MAGSPTFPPTASTRQQKRRPPPLPNAHPVPKQCTRQSMPPPKPRCIQRKRKNSPAIRLRGLPSAAAECLEIHFAFHSAVRSALHSELHSALSATIPRNRKTPPPSKSAKPQSSAQTLRAGPESAMDKEDRKQLPPANHIHARQSANTKGCRNAPKFQAAHSANHQAQAGSR